MYPRQHRVKTSAKASHACRLAYQFAHCKTRPTMAKCPIAYSILCRLSSQCQSKWKQIPTHKFGSLKKQYRPTVWRS